MDLSRISTRAVRVNISLPEALAKTLDDEARARSMNRSGFFGLCRTQGHAGGARSV